MMERKFGRSAGTDGVSDDAGRPQLNGDESKKILNEKQRRARRRSRQPYAEGQS